MAQLSFFRVVCLWIIVIVLMLAIMGSITAPPVILAVNNFEKFFEELHDAVYVIVGVILTLFALLLDLSIIAVVFDSGLRNKYLFAIEDVWPQKRLVLWSPWNKDKEEEKYAVLRPGMVMWLPFLWRKEDFVDIKPFVLFPHKSQKVNTSDDVMEVEFYYSVKVKIKEKDKLENGTEVDTDKYIIDYFKNLGSRDRMRKFVSAFSLSALKLIPSRSEEYPWKCTSEGVAGTSQKTRQEMSRIASEILTKQLLEGHLGLEATIDIYRVDISPILRRAIDRKVAAEQISERRVRLARGQAEAMKVRAEGIALFMKKIVDTGTDKIDLSKVVLAEVISANIGDVLQNIAEIIVTKNKT